MISQLCGYLYFPGYFSPLLFRKEKNKMSCFFCVIKKILLKLLIAAILIVVMVPSYKRSKAGAEEWSEAEARAFYKGIPFTDISSGLTEIGTNLTTDILSMGGGGMLFNPQISPFDSNLFTVLADMGGMYISRDAGESWERKYFKNVVYTSCFDPNRENVIYAGGAGLYRSIDYGVSFQMIFPSEEDVLEMHNNGEAYDVQIFTASNIYPTYLQISNVMINPENSDNIFVTAGYGTVCMVFESVDNGQTFTLLGSHTKEKYNPDGSIYALTELFYATETDTLYIGIEDGIFRLNRETGRFEAAVYSSAGIADVSTFQDGGRTWFIYLEKDNPHEKSNVGVYATADFDTIIDLTDKITSDLSTTFWSIYYPLLISFRYDFNHVKANSPDQIFLSSVSLPTGTSYPYRICGLLYHHDGKTEWLYGNPYKDTYSIENSGYSDEDGRCFGIAADWKQPGRFIEGTHYGILYSPDGEEVYQLTTNRSGTGFGDYYFSRGIDEHFIYKIVEDPFDENHVMMLSTDWGLQESFDRGRTFRLCNQGIPQSWKNTSYDLAFNKNKEGIVYSIWSGNHSGTWGYLQSLNTLDGGFAYSADGGEHWDIHYSAGLPEKCLPVEMSLVYPDDSDEVTIYVATHMNGFYVSYDSGRTFNPVNGGLDTVNHYNYGVWGVSHTCIPATDIETGDGRVFGIIQSVSGDPSSPSGGVYELINGIWNKIEIRSFESGKYAALPKDINYYDGMLFINYVSYPVVLDSDVNGYYTNHGGGVICWDGKEAIQIFDEACPTTGFQMSTDGTIYISDLEGNIYRKKFGSNWEMLYRHFHISGAEIQLYEDHTLYYCTGGGGALRISGLD